MTMQSPISVIIPVGERHGDLRELHTAYKDHLREYTVEYNYIVDGEAGDALIQLQGLISESENVRVFQLARRFGEATALRVGFEKATADVLLTLPAFFQVESKELHRVLEALEDCDMVICKRHPRVDSRFNRVQSRFFHWGLGRVTGNQFSDLGCGVRAIRRELVEDLPIYGDQHRFLPILAIRLGYQVNEIELAQSEKDPHRRIYTPGVYFRRSLDLLTILFLFKFTQKPLRFFGLIGSGAAAVGGGIISVLVIQRLFFETALGNRPLLFLAALLVILGVQLLALGLIGELLIFIHARDLKEYRVKEVVGRRQV
jgi:glycosyltransferase involved in cell wall biosynthesis